MDGLDNTNTSLKGMDYTCYIPSEQIQEKLHNIALAQESQGLGSMQKKASGEKYRQQDLYQVIGTEIDDCYMEELKKLVIHPEIIREQGRTMKIVYTPLHGTGNLPVRRILDHLPFFLELFYYRTQIWKFQPVLEKMWRQSHSLSTPSIPGVGGLPALDNVQLASGASGASMLVVRLSD